MDKKLLSLLYCEPTVHFPREPNVDLGRCLLFDYTKQKIVFVVEDTKRQVSFPFAALDAIWMWGDRTFYHSEETAITKEAILEVKWLL